MSLIIGDRIHSLRTWDRKVAAGEVMGVGCLQGHPVAYVQWDDLKPISRTTPVPVRWIETILVRKIVRVERAA